MRPCWLVPLVGALGCTPKADPIGGGDSGEDSFAAEVSWEPCSLYEGEDDGKAECAATEMPLFWDQGADGGSIAVWSKRLRATEASDVQLWLLHGGPGASGLYDHPARMEWIQSWYPTADIYTIDHRGTGYTERLGCSSEEAGTPGGSSITAEEMPDCIAEIEANLGERLDAYTTTASARDVLAYIDAERADGKRVVVWGGSYGSYWAQRVLRLDDSAIDGVVIEGLLPADGTLITSEANTDHAAQRLFAQCAEDETCGAHLGADPWARLQALLESMDEGHCNEGGLNREIVSAIFAYTMYSRAGLGVIPAAVWRLERCSDEDVSAIITMYQNLFGSGGAWDIASYSILLQHHVTYGELWRTPEFEGVDLDAYFDAVYDETYINKGYGYTKAALETQWPAYTDPEHAGQWPETDTPILMMQGMLDPITTHDLAQPMAERYAAPTQTYVAFPYAGHSVSTDSPSADGSNCGAQLMASFMDAPGAVLDTSCVADTLPLDFDPSSGYANFWFGTDSYWD